MNGFVSRGRSWFGQWTKTSLIGLLSMGSAWAGDLEVEIQQIVTEDDPTIDIIVELSREPRGLPDTEVDEDELEDGLTIEGVDFEVESVETFEDSDYGFGTVLLIDGSHSMHPAREDVRAAVDDFIDGMGDDDSAMVAIFNQPRPGETEGAVYGLQTGWLDDEDDLREHVNQLFDEIDFRNQFTHFNQALNETIDEIIAEDQSTGRPNGRSDVPARRGILVLSDGHDSLHWSTDEDAYDQAYPAGLAETRAQDNDIRISSVFYAPAEESNRRVLVNMAEVTDGSVSDAESREQIRGEFRTLQNRIHSFWVIRIITGELIAGQTYPVRLEIEDDDEPVLDSQSFTISGAWEGDDDLMSTQELLLDPLEEEATDVIEDRIDEGSDDSSRKLYIIVGVTAGSLLLLLVIVSLVQGRKRRRAEASAMQAQQEAQAAKNVAEQAVSRAAAVENRMKKAEKAAAEKAAAEAAAAEAAAAEAAAAEAAAAEAAAAEAATGGETTPEIRHTGWVSGEPPEDESGRDTGTAVESRRSRKTILMAPAGDDAAPRVVLDVLEGGDTNAQIDVFCSGKTFVRIGSDSERVDLYLSHPTVSGHHCNFIWDSKEGLRVEDVGSSNGTWIEGEDIRGKGSVPLREGQQIHFGLLKTLYTTFRLG